jgi:hypothetical protein
MALLLAPQPFCFFFFSLDSPHTSSPRTSALSIEMNGDGMCVTHQPSIPLWTLKLTRCIDPSVCYTTVDYFALPHTHAPQHLSRCLMPQQAPMSASMAADLGRCSPAQGADSAEKLLQDKNVAACFQLDDSEAEQAWGSCLIMQCLCCCVSCTSPLKPPSSRMECGSFSSRTPCTVP